ncbi:unnamed protein product [Urochloa humidicola]
MEWPRGFHWAAPDPPPRRVASAPWTTLCALLLALRIFLLANGSWRLTTPTLPLPTLAVDSCPCVASSRAHLQRTGTPPKTSTTHRWVLFEMDNTKVIAAGLRPSRELTCLGH